MGATILSDLDGLLKRHYGPQFITDQQQTDPDFIMTLPKASEKPGGEDAAFRFGVRLQRRQNGGAQLQNEQFRTNRTGVRKQAYIAAKVNIWAAELTGFAITLSKDALDTFVSGLDDEFSDALASMKKDMNRQCFGYGKGVLTQVNGAVSASTSVVCDSVQYFYPGMKLDFWTALSGGTKQASAVEISSINVSTKTLTMASAVTVDDDSYIFRDGIYDSAPSDGKEMMGLDGIADDGTLVSTFQGLSRSTYSTLKGTLLNASSASISGDLMQQLIDLVETTSGKKVDRIVSHRTQRRLYLNLLTPQKRFMDDKLDAGFSVLEYNGLPWAVSHDCPESKIFCYPRNSVERYEALPTTLGGVESSGRLDRKTNYDVYESFYRNYGNIGSKQPNSVGKLHTLATS